MQTVDDKDMFSKIIRLPIYNVLLEVLIHETKESFIKSIGESGKNYDSVTYVEDEKIYVHFDVKSITEYNSQIKTNSIIVHESIHLKNLLFSIVNIQLDLDNDENEAYYTQFIFEELYKTLENFFNLNNI